MEQATGAAGAAPSAAGHIAAFLELIGHVMHHNKEKQSLHHAHAEAKLLLKVAQKTGSGVRVGSRLLPLAALRNSFVVP